MIMSIIVGLALAPVATVAATLFALKVIDRNPLQTSLWNDKR